MTTTRTVLPDVHMLVNATTVRCGTDRWDHGNATHVRALVTCPACLHALDETRRARLARQQEIDDALHAGHGLGGMV